MSRRFARLSSSDLSNLRFESPKSPFHFGGLAIVEAGPLLDSSGGLRLAEIQGRLERRLARVPELRRRVYFPGPLRGRALWVDDDRFDTRRHVLETEIAAPGGETELLETAARLFGTLLDRSQPLWELWFVTGLSENRVGLLLKLHHSVADGMGALAIMGSLFDLEADVPEPAALPWSAAPIPGAWPLLADSLSTKLSSLGQGAAILAHPARVLRKLSSFAREARQASRTRPRASHSSLNRVVQTGRRVSLVRLDLLAVKEQAHAAGGKVNDVVLDLIAGGLRALLIARGEPVTGLDVVVSVAVALRTSAEAKNLGNEVGVIAVPLAVGEADAHRRLEMIVASTRRAKAEQHAGALQSVLGVLAATPIAQYFIAHQHLVSAFSTNLVGPPVPVYVLGARILDVVPIVEVAGNVAIAFGAISYDGRLNLVATADATAFPDLDLVTAGIDRTWHQLADASPFQQADWDGTVSRPKTP